MTLLALAFSSLHGEIRNGYANGISGARESLRSLQVLVMKEGITAAQRRKAELSLRQVMTYIVYYELTETLLSQFRIISPEQYNQIDTIRDRRGRATHVYVKFIPEDEANILSWGVTNVAQVAYDEDAYFSEYGEHSVSIKVWIVNKALEVLAHELGHVLHQVPHLASYVAYYKFYYGYGRAESNFIGHDPTDVSGKSADSFAKRYRETRYHYWKNGYDHLPSPLNLLETIRREVNVSITNHRVAIL